MMYGMCCVVGQGIFLGQREKSMVGWMRDVSFDFLFIFYLVIFLVVEWIIIGAWVMGLLESMQEKEYKKFGGVYV